MYRDPFERDNWSGKMFMAFVAILIGWAFYADKTHAAEVTVTPYVWAVKSEGTIKAFGRSTSTDASLSDVLDNYNGAALGTVEVGDADWFVLLDYLYLGQSVGYVNLDNSIRTLAVGWLLDEDLYVYAGARDWQVDLALHAGPLRAGDGGDWTDAVAGVRIRVPLADGWAMQGSADYGQNQDFNLDGRLSYGSGAWAAFVGYRVLGVDRGWYSETVQGPLAGFSLLF